MKEYVLPAHLVYPDKINKMACSSIGPMVLCQQDRCKHLVPVKDRFDGQEFIIGYQCEEGFTTKLTTRSATLAWLLSAKNMRRVKNERKNYGSS